MKTGEEKLRVLADVARALNERQITWAAGASLLLYFNGLVPDFRDIDLMVAVEDAQRAKEALLQLGTLTPPDGNRHYRTRYFMEFVIDGVEVDAIAGMVIEKDGVYHDCPFSASHIEGRAELMGEVIPLQALSDWRDYYGLMGREERIRLIDRQLPDGGLRP